ncbi:hypothetical protein [Chryseobacterium sp. KMC2]|uniref:hypothetical protein n=1 Tax=Chryseobacterium sp. KMC2 TaxID=2800705 RepID=UPI0019209716|nr:hypothetical protein [Chryseobacterium sp. KMC2]MBL3547126.1 hypothetical protein [Chryseobacterium sp. KMC2]
MNIFTKNIIGVRSFSILICSVLGSAAFSQTKSYTPVSRELYHTIMERDSTLFSAANSGDIDKLKTFFHQRP